MARKYTARRNNLDIYEDFSEEWWEAASPVFRSLQKITIYRLQLLRKWIPDLHSQTVVDLGCGGGLLSSPLSKSGSKVYGFDISLKSLAQARKHSAESAVYAWGDIRSVDFPSASADVVLLADVLDHLPDYEKTLAEAFRIVRPGGKVFVNTLNRTILCRLLAVHVAENIGLVPKGTHDPKLFIRPAELQKAAGRQGLHVLSWQGERPALRETWRTWAIHFAGTKSLSIAYSALLERSS